MVVIRNGVDTSIFNPDQDTSDPWFKMPYKHVLSVGNLTELKGHDLVVKAVAQLPSHALTIVGDGEERSNLESLVGELGVSGRVRLIPPVNQTSLAALYASSDVLVLASSREGWPNVILEALACNTQVLATNVGGVKEIIDNDGHGYLIKSRSTDAIVESLKKVEANHTESMRSYVSEFAWDHVVEKQNRLYQEVAKQL